MGSLLSTFMRFLGILTGLIFLPALQSSASESSFQNVETRNDISLFKRNVVVNGVHLTEAKSLVKINAKLETVLGVIHHEIISAEIKLKQGHGFVVHGLVHKQPISPREAYLWITLDCKQLTYANKGVEIVFTTQEPRAAMQPTSKDVVRLPLVVGSCSLWPAEDKNQTYVEYHVLFDLGGSSAVRIWNDWAVQKIAYQAMVFLRKQSEKETKFDVTKLKADVPQVFSGCL